MKSIKPGRGPSAMEAIGSIAVGVFGVIWIFAAANMGAPIFFVLFGIVFVGIAVIQGIYHFKNATGTNRMSVFDITDGQSEPDPLENMMNRRQAMNANESSEVNYCPYCGNKIMDNSYKFCSKCGKELDNH
ncbi:MAG: zinc ribbon domain-containing protein [Paenibacillus dendritiformis]|uniref:zinc ribbon domain-containing protein n=1 Tax=Paenibacillus dendritiformis TaxID=130049 RepID=UPI00143D53D5|nr:zinc ribbon domain-containing protein [Paenibacillus dendritiformis]MDU5142987.1 zinc ribbon domain-containing protein [Paenibacillus dendritiformis]NKI19875.1 zinc-ribbon domain-containing protein [Paenibacillus dendritiformis]NRG01263.1 zinc ribbon domain-containing protein [Paenibacillus dendritiformis]